MRGIVLSEIRGLPDQPMLINPPRGWLLMQLVRLWSFILILSVMSYSIFLFISLPLLSVVWFYYYQLTVKWKNYRYSGKLLHIATAIWFVMSIILGIPIRSGIITLLSPLFSPFY